MIKESFDIAVIGGGPAGIIAAGRAAESGAKVVLIEKNDKLGVKLLLTGRGRCNLTQSEFNVRKFVEKFGQGGNFLFSPLSLFGIKDTMEFFEKKGLKLKTERGQRVFPLSNLSSDVLGVLKNYLRKGKVSIMTNSEVIGIKKNNNHVSKIILKGREIIADKYIFCTGGKSCAQTGSTGDGFKWAKQLGHTIIELSPALTPIKIKEKWIKETQGLSLKNVNISVWQNNKKKDEVFGEALFTHFGLSGPIILDLSKKIGQLLKTGEVKLSLDLKPALDFIKLDNRIKRDFDKYRKKLFKNSLNDLLPQKFIPLMIKFSGINPEKKVNTITKGERNKLVKSFKNIEMSVSGVCGFNQSIITSGGVSLKEIDSKTMKSKIIDNLFLAGEIIDLDGPTGGYNLQVCWTTGYLSGQYSAEK
ncbi:MAG: NAD(P)/FAD-dependent oxidoreductase [Patescibacteria group bacterium]